MRYLFLYHSPDVLGGIETLISRMSKWLIARGDHVTLLTTSVTQWKGILPAGIECRTPGKRFRDLYYPLHAARLWKELEVPDVDIIKTFDLPTSWVGCILSGLMSKAAKVISGIYNPHVFAVNRGRQVLMDGWPLYLRNFLENIPNDARILWVPDEIRELQDVHGPNQSARLWPLPIDGERFRNVVRTPKWGQIVSIGRLALMKEYNLYMVEVIGALRAAGYDVKWDVFGTGPYEPQMRALIKQHKLEEHIILRGELEYHRFAEALQNAYVFVGTGTALLEAAFCGVPSVLTLAYETAGMTYGPIHRLPFGMAGQLAKEPPRFKVLDEITRILELSPQDYQKESEQTLECVQGYCLDPRMKEFETLVAQAGYPNRRPLLYWQNYLYALGRRVGVRLDNWG
jgi:glycosyltransferase involved in cell wall biosynthesis